MMEPDAERECRKAESPVSVSFQDAFRFWLKLGLISFGGPAGQISIMHQELVVNRRWISERRFLHALNYCMLLPGPEAQQLAIYLGWLMHRTLGGIVAGTLFVLPSLLILIAFSWLYMAFGDIVWVSGLFYGIKPAVTAIVLLASQKLASRSLNNWLLWLIGGSAFLAIFVFNVPFPLIVLSAGLIGFLGGRTAPGKFAASGHADCAKSFGTALIDDHSPVAEHTRFRWPMMLKTAVSGIGLWLLPMALLIWHFGWQHGYSQMAWFFTKTALLTFGGAYAVLPYVYQGAVVQYQWLSPAQMMDGLALGETTPGPLIMVVAFVGFAGAYANSFLGSGHDVMAGVLAACLVTWFTFLPSFLFILAGGPLIESTHGNLRFTAPLTAISAAVVGVILNLALFFAYHTFWPNGFQGNFDGYSAGLAALAAVALIRFKQNVITVIVGCAAAGLLFKLLI
jgi:chromate transporter